MFVYCKSELKLKAVRVLISQLISLRCRSMYAMKLLSSTYADISHSWHREFSTTPHMTYIPDQKFYTHYSLPPSCRKRSDTPHIPNWTKHVSSQHFSQRPEYHTLSNIWKVSTNTTLQEIFPWRTFVMSLTIPQTG